MTVFNIIVTTIIPFLMLNILPDLDARAQIIHLDTIPTLLNMLENADEAPAAVEALTRLLLNGVWCVFLQYSSSTLTVR